MNPFKRYYLVSLAAILAASFYPLYMGARVVGDMLRVGTVNAERYPKYVIPYTPIALALIVGVALMPLAFRLVKKAALLAGSAVSMAVFLVSELLLESRVTVTGRGVATLEGWQMYMCYIPPDMFETRTYTAIDVLIGEYSPAFKLHFYLISAILILSLLNCIYGFAKMIRTKDSSRQKALIMQSASSAVFLGLCILACFTAFYRTGEITVSPLSAFLMCLFFIVMGVTFGIYVGSFLLRKRRLLSVVVPSVVAAVVTLAMYIGETVLLSGHLYRFGKGFFFDGLGALVLAPVDICVILLSGIAVFGIMSALTRKSEIKRL